MALDKRGGFFEQEDMEIAMTRLHGKMACKASSLALAASVGKSPKELIADQSYVVRVQLNHVRIRCKQFRKRRAAGKQPDPKKHTPELEALYQVMPKHLPKSDELDANNKKRNKKKRPCTSKAWRRQFVLLCFSWLLFLILFVG